MGEAPKEPRHPIQVVARRTGLTPDVIRVWERRYAVVSPGRSSTNRRLYSDDDLARLLLLRRATLAGRAIGNVAHLDTLALATLVESDEAAARRVPSSSGPVGATSSESRLDACLDAVRRLDPQRLRAALRAAALELSTPALMQEVLVPLMTRIGDEWRSGGLHVHHEHLATAVVRSLLETLQDGHSGGFGGPAIVVSTPPGERHEIGALMAAVVAAAEGWQILYLGADLPLQETASAVRRAGARVVALSFVDREFEPGLADGLARMRGLLPPDTVILVGGRSAVRYEDILAEIGAKRVSDMSTFRAELARLAGRPQ